VTATRDSTQLKLVFIQEPSIIHTNAPSKSLLEASSKPYAPPTQLKIRIHLINKPPGKKVYGNGFEGAYVATHRVVSRNNGHSDDLAEDRC